MIDIGVNLTNPRFDYDRNTVITSAQAAGITHLLITGTSIDDSKYAAQLASNNSTILSATAGVHPHYAEDVHDDFIQHLALLAKTPEVKAIGECGLDFNRNFTAPVQQLNVFKQQVALAAQLEMPLFLHQRDAFEPWFDILRPFFDKIPAMVAHCFTGDKASLQTCLDAGMYIGITGWVCDERRGVELQEAVKQLPLSQLMIETDAPYLIPRTIKPKPKNNRNEPQYLSYIADKIAELKQVDVKEVVYHATKNTKQVFKL